MTFEEIQRIITYVNESDITKFDLDFEDGHIQIDKTRQSALDNLNTSQIPASDSHVTDALVPIITEKIPPADDKVTTVKAPLVGIVYLQSGPDAAQYKKPGDHVQKGDVVCLIEAMKMMTEIKSEVSGTVAEILVSNEEVVEFDQPLLTIKTD
jgi:acetyl-CoA carboxylase biotin carboxyl carrier protein